MHGAIGLRRAGSRPYAPQHVTRCGPGPFAGHLQTVSNVALHPHARPMAAGEARGAPTGRVQAQAPRICPFSTRIVHWSTVVNRWALRRTRSSAWAVPIDILVMSFPPTRASTVAGTGART